MAATESKWELLQAAFDLRNSTPPVTGPRLLAPGKPKTVALVAILRKQLATLNGMHWKDGCRIVEGESPATGG